MMRYVLGIIAGMVMSANAAIAQVDAAADNALPVEVHSDTLDVYQNENKAIFRGNVIATRGVKKLRSDEMIVFYRNDGDAGKKVAPIATADATAKGIYRIEAERNVVFTTPEETAVGEKGVYDVDKDTIELFGSNVTLTRGQNVLKGTHVVHNLTTGRSVMTSGDATSGKPARVHGLFVPEKKDKKDAESGASEAKGAK